MHLKQINARGFKVRNFTHSLSPLVHISGPNFSGKSSIMEAIRFALLGCLPENGKTPEANFRLADGLEMAVSAVLDNGQVIERRMWRDGDQIRSANNLKQPFNLPLLNSEEYFGLTETERMAYVTSRMPLPDNGDPGKIAENVKTALGADCDPEISGNITSSIHLALTDHGIQDGLRYLLDSYTLKQRETLKIAFNLPERYTYWNGRQKDTIGAVRTYTELKNREGECSAETIEEIEAEIAETNAKLTTWNQRQGKIVQAQQSNNRTALRRKEIAAALAQPEPSDEKLKVMQSELEKLQAVPKLEGKTLEEMRPEWDAIIAEQTKGKTELDGLERKLDEVKKDQAELADQSCCPNCGSKGKTWKKTLEAKYTKDKVHLLVHMAELQDELNLIAIRREKLHSEMETRRAAEKADLDTKSNRIRLVSEVANEQRRITNEDQRRETIRAELAAMTEAPAVEDAETVSAAVLNLSTTLENLQGRRDTAKRLQGDIQRAAEAHEEHQKAVVNFDAIKSAWIYLREYQGKLVNALMGTLLTRANAIFPDIMRAPLAIQDGEVGYTLNGRFVSHHTFSGTEKILTYIAISASLSNDGPVLIDEFGRVDDANKLSVMTALFDAVERGYIQQAILVETAPLGAIFETWQRIELESAK